MMNHHWIKIFILSVLFSVSRNALCTETSSYLIGGYGSIFIHESGHALATQYLGGEVLAFRPYPTKLLYVEPNGVKNEKWVLGVVAHKPFEGENGDQKNAIVAGMGSVGNMLSVFILAPLLPKLNSNFSKATLDSMLYFSSFEMAAYTTADMIFQNPHGDWSQVSKLTGTSLYWYLLAGFAGGFLANEYRYYWHKKAFPNEPSPQRLSIGFSTSY